MRKSLDDNCQLFATFISEANRSKSHKTKYLGPKEISEFAAFDTPIPLSIDVHFGILESNNDPRALSVCDGNEGLLPFKIRIKTLRRVNKPGRL
jgi:hypothetical protein